VSPPPTAAVVDRADRLDADERAAMGGDRDAFSRIVRRHQRSVFFTALRMGRDEQFARDIAQKTFLQAWTKRDSFRAEASLKTWLLRITTNLALNELRRAWRHREVVLEDPQGEARLGTVESRAFTALATAEARGLLRQAVAALSPRQRAVAVLRIYEELSFADIAVACDITANNAKVNFHHAVRNIQRSLAEAGVAA
jgi:RNA polymerase sigma-70 factor (ECF subfamily)